MRTIDQKKETREENLAKKVDNAETIGILQERLKKSLATQKANKDDKQVDYYQSGRQVELRYCIKLLLTPRDRYRLGKSKNPKQFVLSSKRRAIKES